MASAFLEGWRLVLIAIALCLFVGQGYPQQPALNPSPDTLDLYASFFHFHDDFSRWTDNRAAINAPDTSKFLQGVATYLHVTVVDLPKIAVITHAAVASLKSLNAETRAYVDKVLANRQVADKPTLYRFEARRQQIIQSAINQLKQSLSPASWNGLHSYINEEHRRNTRIFVSAPIPPPGSTK